jgi:hypothetical protein
MNTLFLHLMMRTMEGEHSLFMFIDHKIESTHPTNSRFKHPVTFPLKHEIGKQRQQPYHHLHLTEID